MLKKILSSAAAVCVAAVSVLVPASFNAENEKIDSQVAIAATETTEDPVINAHDFIVDKGTKTFHRQGCSHAPKSDDKNYELIHKTANRLQADGYKPCKYCSPETLTAPTEPSSNSERYIIPNDVAADGAQGAQNYSFIINTKTKKFHLPTCSKAPTTNAQTTNKSASELIAEGYEPCEICHPAGNLSAAETVNNNSNNSNTSTPTQNSDTSDRTVMYVIIVGVLAIAIMVICYVKCVKPKKKRKE